MHHAGALSFSFISVQLHVSESLRAVRFIDEHVDVSFFVSLLVVERVSRVSEYSRNRQNCPKPHAPSKGPPPLSPQTRPLPAKPAYGPCWVSAVGTQ